MEVVERAKKKKKENVTILWANVKEKCDDRVLFIYLFEKNDMACVNIWMDNFITLFYIIIIVDRTQDWQVLFSLSQREKTP